MKTCSVNGGEERIQQVEYCLGSSNDGKADSIGGFLTPAQSRNQAVPPITNAFVSYLVS
jgi:hypothetical protein